MGAPRSKEAGFPLNPRLRDQTFGPKAMKADTIIHASEGHVCLSVLGLVH